MDRPNIVVLTIGRTGSSVLCRMLEQLGWNLPGADKYAENVEFRDINECLLRDREDQFFGRAWQLLDALPEPWILKDPRLLHTWEHWVGLLRDQNCLLLWLIRDEQQIRQSLQRAGWGRSSSRGLLLRDHTLRETTDLCQRIYDDWPERKFHVDYAQLQAAIRLFDVDRSRT